MLCSRPQCRLELPAGVRRCDCGALAQSRIRIRLQTGQRVGTWYIDRPGTYEIGRSAASHVVEIDLTPYLGDPRREVSRVHAVLTWRGRNSIRITRKSENGTVSVAGKELELDDGEDAIVDSVVVVALNRQELLIDVEA